MSNVSEIQKHIENLIDKGHDDLSEIYDTIEAMGYARPTIRRAKAFLLDRIDQQIKERQKRLKILRAKA